MLIGLQDKVFTTNATASKRLFGMAGNLKERNLTAMGQLALKYPPFAMALTWAILEETGNKAITEPLRKSLNPITIYKLPGVNKIFTSVQNWNIRG